jgi:hypothetical protein
MSDQNSAMMASPLSYNDTALFKLPVRGEKCFIPIVVPSQLGKPGGVVNEKLIIGDSISDQDLETSAAHSSPYAEYVRLRIPGRGTTETGVPDPSASIYFQFLINPAQITITRQQLDAQAMARAGWQLGVWGEDFISITMEGRTPGRYFANGLTDEYADFSMSFRHLEALEVFVENNGYWFEGEQSAEGPLATAGFTRRQIKMHTDVELSVGEFIWSGMFESMTIREDSQNPYLQVFSLSFIAWKEAFFQETPYLNPIDKSVQRGHTPNAYVALGATGAGAIPQGSALPAYQPTPAPVPSNIDPQAAGIPSLSDNLNLTGANTSVFLQPTPEWLTQ